MNFFLMIMFLILGMTISYCIISFIISEEPIKQWLKDHWQFIMMGIGEIIFIVALFPLNRDTYENQGIDKFLNKEITIDEMTITYNSQNQPIDTTYSYVRTRN